MDVAVRQYVDAIPPSHRPLFEVVNDPVVQEFPGATLGLSYKMPTYRVGAHHI
jgi:hypothetical protein